MTGPARMDFASRTVRALLGSTTKATATQERPPTPRSIHL
jgi:hypothetical protein